MRLHEIQQKGRKTVAHLLEDRARARRHLVDGSDKLGGFMHCCTLLLLLLLLLRFYREQPAVPEERNSQLRRRSSVLFCSVCAGFSAKVWPGVSRQSLMFFFLSEGLLWPLCLERLITALLSCNLQDIKGQQVFLCIFTTRCLQPRASELFRRRHHVFHTVLWHEGNTLFFCKLIGHLQLYRNDT